MPKFIGRTIPGAKQIPDNSTGQGPLIRASFGGPLIRISYAQARLLPPDRVYYSLDTTDQGGRRSYAKRWYRWFASPETIAGCPRSTPKMLREING